MARLINVEKSKYINSNISIYSKNKIGQYSKFLSKNPIFVTYYHINKQMTRSDVGTGGIESELGKTSPIRFNKIETFPVYNLPELKPDITFDETGFDIDIELSDITILPNTIKPYPGDYMLVSIPNSQDVLLRVNNINYNTIQSNDFYLVDLDIKQIDADLSEFIKPGQIVDTYQTIFENIGTQDRCFIRVDDIEKLNAIVKTLNQLKDFYKDTFYNVECNSFVLYNNYPCECQNETWLYDPFLETFINRSNIYYEENNEAALVLTPNDILPLNFDYQFSRTLWYAVLNRTTDYLTQYSYYYQSSIVKRFSPFKMYNYPCNSVKIEFFDDPKDTDTSGKCNDNIEYQMTQRTQCFPVSNEGFGEYFDHILIEDIMNGELSSDDYLNKIVYNYIMNIDMEIDKDILLKYTFNHTIKSFHYIPLVMYIIIKRYNEYFNTYVEL